MKRFKNLVRLLDLDSEFIIDLKYATADNFTGEIVYNSKECYLDVHTAEALIKAKNIFKEKDYKVKIWDAFRPISAQEKFWDIVRDNNFVAYPPDMANIKEFKASHMNGQCVDITLVDRDGNDIEMPSQFDDFSEKARPYYDGISEEAHQNALYLQQVMVDCGFTPYKNEWWHFYDRNAPEAPYLYEIQ